MKGKVTVLSEWAASSFDVDHILKTYGDMVFKIAFSQTKKQQDAEDVFQEVFLRLVKYRAKIESEEHLKAWLIRVTINCCKDIFLNPWNKLTTQLDENIPTEDDRPTNDLYHLVMDLPEVYKTVIHLFYYEDLSITTIATTLETKESTVKSWLHRGRKLLQKKIEREDLRHARRI